MINISKISAQIPASIGTAMQQFRDVSEAGDGGAFVNEDDHHVFKHDRLGRFLSSCTMTPTALTEAVLSGKADYWNVVDYDQETCEAVTICPRCAVGLSCRGGRRYLGSA